jgi:hypothetical protein
VIQLDEAIRSRIGQRIQYDSFNNRKHGGICADGKRQRQYSGHGEAGPLAELPKGIAEVAQDLMNHIEPFAVRLPVASMRLTNSLRENVEQIMSDSGTLHNINEQGHVSVPTAKAVNGFPGWLVLLIVGLHE